MERTAEVTREQVFDRHTGGKLAVKSRIELSPDELAVVYTPGVALVCEEIATTPERARDLTWTANNVAIVTDGSAVLGLGDIGPRAAMPVMEGKALLFKSFAGVDGVPLCLATNDVDEIVDTVVRIAPSFGGINLEDISAPRCFEIEERLQEALDIPVFHDDQHGTAIVVLAALRAALELTGRAVETARIVITGAGAAGVACAYTLLDAGARDLVVVDRGGVLSSARTDLPPVKRKLATATADRVGRSGDLESVLAGADVLVGVSGGAIPERLVAQMSSDSIVFALANPQPEVHPDVAGRYARVVATGRSDFPNQINNVLAFPGLFRGALDVAATRITPGMRLAAADALHALVGPAARPDYVIPEPFDPRVVPAVSGAVAAAAREDGVITEAAT